MKPLPDSVFKTARDAFLRMPHGTVRQRDEALREALQVALKAECKALRAELSQLHRELDLESRRLQAFEDAEPDARKLAVWACEVSMAGTNIRAAAERVLAYMPGPSERPKPEAPPCEHDWQDIGGAASADSFEVFQQCTKCRETCTVETPRARLPGPATGPADQAQRNLAAELDLIWAAFEAYCSDLTLSSLQVYRRALEGRSAIRGGA